MFVPYTPTERDLERFIARNDLKVCDLNAVENDLRGELRGLPAVEREIVLNRLKSRAVELRARAEFGDAVLYEILVRSIEHALK